MTPVEGPSPRESPPRTFSSSPGAFGRDGCIMLRYTFTWLVTAESGLENHRAMPRFARHDRPLRGIVQSIHSCSAGGNLGEVQRTQLRCQPDGKRAHHRLGIGGMSLPPDGDVPQRLQGIDDRHPSVRRDCLDTPIRHAAIVRRSRICHGSFPPSPASAKGKESHGDPFDLHLREEILETPTQFLHAGTVWPTRGLNLHPHPWGGPGRGIIQISGIDPGAGAFAFLRANLSEWQGAENCFPSQSNRTRDAWMLRFIA